METTSATCVYFSPTGTGKRVLQAIAEGLGLENARIVDITRPRVRETPLTISETELLLIAVPVYMGRVPALLDEWLGALQARGTPAVCVVVYGNRAYENALLELCDRVAASGAAPIASAAYIGEHSFADDEKPVALGRPDAQDLAHARAFGQAVREKLDAATSVADLAPVQTPGERPYGGRTQLWDLDFIAVSEACTQCGLCAELCPVEAIDPQDSSVIDQQACITCCACIKACPEQARSKKPSPVQDAANRLDSLHKEPKTPECFL